MGDNTAASRLLDNTAEVAKRLAHKAIMKVTPKACKAAEKLGVGSKSTEEGSSGWKAQPAAPAFVPAHKQTASCPAGTTQLPGKPAERQAARQLSRYFSTTSSLQEGDAQETSRTQQSLSMQSTRSSTSLITNKGIDLRINDPAECIEASDEGQWLTEVLEWMWPYLRAAANTEACRIVGPALNNIPPFVAHMLVPVKGIVAVPLDGIGLALRLMDMLGPNPPHLQVVSIYPGPGGSTCLDWRLAFDLTSHVAMSVTTSVPDDGPSLGLSGAAESYAATQPELGTSEGGSAMTGEPTAEVHGGDNIPPASLSIEQYLQQGGLLQHGSGHEVLDPLHGLPLHPAEML